MEVVEDLDENSYSGDEVVIFDRNGFKGGKQFVDSGSGYSHYTLERIRRRELKWMDVLSNWEFWMSTRSHWVRDRCRKGIPPAIRGRVWQYLCGSYLMVQRNPGRYQSLLSQPTEEKTIVQIRQDINRQFPNHAIFCDSNGIGQTSLFNVLKAFCNSHQETGYCQAHAPLASALLIHLPEEEAFWTFCTICERYMPDYFEDNLIRLKVELNMLQALCARYLPKVHEHLMRHKVEPIFFAVDWFMCLFTRNLPWDCVLRILDMFFFEGIKVIFRIALAILSLLIGSPDSRRRLNSANDLLESLRRLPEEVTSEKTLLPAVSMQCV
ncbi:unnamed protein product [Calicophoron daubneyi]|uniref:Rab-GAP TBC domain-containing protein n=1 Tax=Calicophoron daubneyi TaxID=300641 RepID=A0AAV2U0P6_CALDB